MTLQSTGHQEKKQFVRSGASGVWPKGLLEISHLVDREVNGALLIMDLKWTDLAPNNTNGVVLLALKLWVHVQ